MIFDSSIIIYLMRGNSKAADLLGELIVEGRVHAISSITITEIEHGFQGSLLKNVRESVSYMI